MYNNSCNLQAKVSALINNREWRVPTPLERATPDIANLIRESQVKGVANEVIWTTMKQGVYTLNETYEEVRRKKDTSIMAQYGLACEKYTKALVPVVDGMEWHTKDTEEAQVLGCCTT